MVYRQENQFDPKIINKLSKNKIKMKENSKPDSELGLSYSMNNNNDRTMVKIFRSSL